MEIPIDKLDLLINSEDTPEMAYNLGLVAIQDKDFISAINHFTHAINLTQNFIIAYLKRAECYINQTRFKEAFEDYKFIFEKNKEVNYAIACSNMLRLNGNNDDAILWANKAQIIDANNWEVYLVRGLCYFDQGNHIVAFKDLSICLTLFPENIQAYIQAGNILGQMGMHSEAIIYFSKGLEKTKNDEERGMLLYNRAVSKSQIKDENFKLDFELAAGLNFEPAKSILNQINKSQI